MKKYFALLLAALLTLSLLAACGGETASQSQPQAESTQAVPEETRAKLTSAQIQEIALAEAGYSAEHLNSIVIHQGEYEGRECVSVQLIIRDRDFEFVLDVYTGEVLLSVLPED